MVAARSARTDDKPIGDGRGDEDADEAAEDDDDDIVAAPRSECRLMGPSGLTPDQGLGTGVLSSIDKFSRLGRNSSISGTMMGPRKISVRTEGNAVLGANDIELPPPSPTACGPCPR